MSTVSVIYDLIGRDNLSGTFKKAGDSADGLHGKLSKLGAAAVATGAAIAAGGAAIAVESVKAAVTFQASMERVHTQAGVAQSKIAGLSQGVLDLAGKTGFGPDSLAESLYHVASNMESLGATGPQMLNAVKIAAEGARVGGADLVDVTNALGAAIASGIPGVQNYQSAMGVLNATVGAGDMKMQDLADAMGTGFLSNVKLYGSTLNDVGAALATFGDNNIRGAEAGTQLRIAVQAIAVQAKTAGPALKLLGLQVGELGKYQALHGTVATIDLLSQRLKAAGIPATQYGQIITELFGKKAGSGIGVLIDQVDRLDSKQAVLNKGAKNFGAEWQATQKTASAQFAMLRGGVDALGIKIGLALLPPVTSFVQFLNKTAVPAVSGFAKKVASLIPVKTIEDDVNKTIGFIKGLFGIGDSKPKPVQVPFTAKGMSQPTPQSLFNLPESMQVPVHPAIMSLSQLHAGMDARSLTPVTASLSSGIGGAVEKAFGNIGKALTTALGKINWPVIGKSLGRGLGSALTAGLAGAGELGQKVIDALGKLDWTEVGKKVGGNAIGFALGFLANLGADLFSPSFWEKHWWDAIIGAASLLGVGKIAGPLTKIVEHIPVLRIFAPLLRGLEKLTGPVNNAIGKVVGAVGRGLLDGFTKVFPEAGRFLEREGGLLGIRLAVAGLRVSEAAVRLAGGIGDGILKGARGLGSVIGRVVSWILLPFAKSGGWLIGKGADVMSGLLRGLADRWPAVIGWVRKIFGWVLGPFARAGSWLLSKGGDVLGGLLRGAQAGWGGVARWLGGMYSRTVGFWIKSNVWLLSKGLDLLAGLLRGAQSGWRVAAGWLGGVGGRVISYFAKAGSWLLGAGSNIIGGFKNGIVGAFRGIGSWIKSTIVDPVVNWVKHWFGIRSPSTVMAWIGSHLMGGLFKGMMSHDLAGMVKTIFGSLPDALGSIVGKGLASLASLPGKALKALGGLGGKALSWLGGLFGGGGGGGVQRWAGLVNQALAMEHLPLSLAPDVLYQMQTESGGNPNAINLTDINAQLGDPSRGLMQVIGATFRYWHWPGTSSNIFDPLANIAAALNYGAHGKGFGTGMGQIGSGHGYASGGIIAEPVLGIGLRSGDPYSFGERGPERVTPGTGPAGPGGHSGPLFTIAGDLVVRDEADAALIGQRLSGMVLMAGLGGGFR